jgi:drug/metabolite transporter (DMT)-like permease
MMKGIFYALAACAIWGLIFVIPQFMSGFAAIEIVLGRHFFYGLISSLIFIQANLRERWHYPKSVWVRALYFSLISTVGYYSFAVLALRYASPAITTLILGISPVAIAFYGNWQQKETSFKNLMIPSLLILTGLAFINIPYLGQGSTYVLGLAFSVLALAAWSWYVVANSRFLKNNPQIPSNQWSTLVGVATLVWVLLFGVILFIFFRKHLHPEKFLQLDQELIHFLLGSAILGLLCSWVGAFLWNKASLLLPVSLAGQLTVFENLFGIIFIYIANRCLPSFFEGVGICIMFAAILYGIRSFAGKHPTVAHA